MDKKPQNLYWHESSVTIKHRWELNEHKSCILWFTGLSASGKSTLANLLCEQLHDRCVKSYILDGDNIRHRLNKDLGFSHEDRKENIRRIGEVARLFVDAGLVAMTAFISPYCEDRENARALFNKGEFVEIYVKCSIPECEKRDPKGIYKKARAGEIKEFTGISAPYEEPQNPEIVLDTEHMTRDQCIQAILSYLEVKEFIPRLGKK
jgi:adenylylsulfate kinase